MPRWLPILLLALPACGGWTLPEEEQYADNPVFDIYEEDVQVPDIPMCGDMQIYPEAVKLFFEGRLEVRGRKVFILD